MKLMYYVSKIRQDNGDHEVHHETCRVVPKPENRRALGEFSDCKDAVSAAKEIYPTADGCKICSPSCNTR